MPPGSTAPLASLHSPPWKTSLLLSSLGRFLTARLLGRDSVSLGLKYEDEVKEEEGEGKEGE